MQPEMNQEAIARMLDQVQKPTRYTGGEMNTQLKPWDSAKLHFAFCFPDTYEVGMSHLGMKILYAAMNQQPDMLCERAFMPWVDMMELMKQENVLLFTLESRSPLSAFDVVGFTLQYEMSYSNILAMLELGGIPLLRENRREEDPIVVAGGPCAFNPEPLADFIDAFMVGDGEEQILDLNRVIMQGREEGASRMTILKRLCAIRGVYVPALYDVQYNADGTIASMKPNCPEAPEKVLKAIIPDGQGVLSHGNPRAVYGDYPRPHHAGNHARLHARLPLLSGGHPVSSGARAESGASGGAGAAAGEHDRV